MFSEKALTERKYRLILLVLTLAGVFSLFSACALRDTTETEHDTAAHDGTVIEETAEDDTSKDSTFPEIHYEISPEADEWIDIYEGVHGHNSASKIIMADDEITAYNRNIADKCPKIIDLSSYPASISGSEVRDMITGYSMPAGEHFDRSGRHVHAEEKTRILENRGLSDIPDSITPLKAVITERCSVKSMPTESDMFLYGDSYYSKIQETELIVSFPVLILHRSADENFLFVQSYYYNGWIPANTAALCSDDEFEFFLSPDRFTVITKPFAEYADSRLDMGTVLPCIGEEADYYRVRIPKRNENGELFFENANINKNDASFGWLDYTPENYYNQAFAFLGLDYGWGGIDGGIDCSGFVCAVFRTFGIYLPRNTGEQRLYSGRNTSLTGMNEKEILDVLRSLTVPASIHRQGHVMLFLGFRDAVPYVIHAPKGGQKVSVMALTERSNLLSVSEIGPYRENID